MTPEQSFLKSILDKSIACITLVLLSPFLLLLSLIIYLRLGSPIFFCQVRPGLNSQPFTIYKFRTMNNACNAHGELLPDTDRLTAMGSLMRKTSLDELPELFNVLKGDMSLVGPRPLLIQYLPYYTLREQVRNSVRPGITGWAQIHGRNHLPWDERLEMDVWYIENWSTWLDLKILAMTAYTVLKRDGVAVDTSEIEGALDKIRQQSAH